MIIALYKSTFTITITITIIIGLSLWLWLHATITAANIVKVMGMVYRQFKDLDRVSVTSLALHFTCNVDKIL